MPTDPNPYQSPRNSHGLTQRRPRRVWFPAVIGTCVGILIADSIDMQLSTMFKHSRFFISLMVGGIIGGACVGHLLGILARMYSDNKNRM